MRKLCDRLVTKADNYNNLKFNMILNAIRGITKIIFPLISFPYASKVLGVEALGQYNYANSIISYIILIAGLGISTYAIREGSQLRDDKAKLEDFACQMFTINIFSTVFAYIILLFIVASVRQLTEYSILIWLLSIQVGLGTIGVEWIYSIYENYLYITIRSILFQFFSIIALFIFVHTPNDLISYTLISVFASAGANILNYTFSRRYVAISLKKEIQWKQHLKPIFILFGMAVTITIYVSSDITMLGAICGDYHVGIYSVSTKLYSIIKTILASVLVVSIPRLSAIAGKDNKEEFESVASDILNTLITLLMPTVFGMIILRREIVLIISDETYISATSSLSILAIALFFCMLAWFWGQCVLIPLGRETHVFRATVLSAIVNVVLNIIFIPQFQENAAAATTVLAQAIAFIYCFWIATKEVSLRKTAGIFIKALLGCLGMVIFSAILYPLHKNTILFTVVTIVCDVFVYLLLECILKNKVVLDAILFLHKKT